MSMVITFNMIIGTDNVETLGLKLRPGKAMGAEPPWKIARKNTFWLFKSLSLLPLSRCNKLKHRMATVFLRIKTNNNKSVNVYKFNPRSVRTAYLERYLLGHFSRVSDKDHHHHLHLTSLLFPMELDGLWVSSTLFYCEYFPPQYSFLSYPAPHIASMSFLVFLLA